MSYSQVDNNKNLVWFLNYCFHVPINVGYKTVIEQQSDNKNISQICQIQYWMYSVW